MNILEMLAERASEAKAPGILPEAAVMRLREAAAAYAEQLRGPRFKVGDLVTPRADSCDVDRGKPHLVIEVRPDATPAWIPDCCGRFGARHDIRLLFVSSAGVSSHWVESFEYEPWTEAPGAAP